MSKFWTFIAACAIATLPLATPVEAKECKKKTVVAVGKMTLTKLAAYPHSLIAWRKAVKEKYGTAYRAWRRSDDRTIDCERVKNDLGKRRWQCTRSAIPCAGNGKGDDAPEYPGKVLRKGSSGDDVETLQRLLDEAGFDVDVDGDFGRKTRRAVKKFQKAEAIEVDGIVGRETWERLAS